MKSCSAVLVLLVVAGCAIQTMSAQQALGNGTKKPPETKKTLGGTSAAEESTSAEEVVSVPVVKLSFSDPKPVSGIPEFHAWTRPVLCGPDGTPFVSVMEPTDYRTRPLYSLDSAGGHTFTTAGVPGLYDFQLISQFVGNSVVGFLVLATRDEAKRHTEAPVMPGSPSHDLYTGEHYSFVVELDRENGQFKRTIELPKEYMFWRVVELEGDSLLAVAYDRTNSVPRLLVVDTDGKVLRTLEVPQSLTQNPQLKEGSSGDFLKQAKAEATMSWWQFANVRKKVLLYQARSHAPVLEVGEGGAVREVPLDAPKGYTLHDVIPANDRWLMEFKKDGLDTEGREVDAHPESRNFVLYEVDPNDGSLRRQIDLVTGRDLNIACEADGSLIGFSFADKLMRVTAEIGR